MRRIALTIPVVVLLSISFAWPAANFPDTIKVPVTFYDFHSDGSNPEFERTPNPPNGGLHTGMVATKLGTNKKPALGLVPYWNCAIAKWFTPWQKGDSLIPNYVGPPLTTDCTNGKTKVNYDTAFINKVFHDTLIFRLVPGSQGTYSFNNAAFFPLDGRGFGNEIAGGAARSHNYSFSMELHWEFSYIPGLTFTFKGDDDVWAFIDGTLSMDLGGIHGATTDSFKVDNLNLDTTLKKHTFDLFYCERHVTASTIQITTNIISAPPAKLLMTAEPDSAIPAGDSVILTASVVDDTGAVRPEFNPYVEWTLVPGKTGSKNTLLTTKGQKNTFYGITAYETDTIYTKFVDPTNPLRILRDTVKIRVLPGPPYKLVIESDTAILDSNKTDPLPFLSMDSASNFDTVFAIVYDRYDNFSGLARTAAWTSLNTGLLTVKGVTNRLYAGEVHRETKEMNTIIIIANQGQLLPDSLPVILQTGNITAIRLISFTGDTVIESININTDQIKSVKIQVKWSNDTTRWVDGTGSWTLVPPNTIKWDAPQPPAPESQAAAWTLNPKTPGQFNLTVSAGIRWKTIPVTIVPAPPSKVSIKIITPLDSIIAGKQFRSVVQIENTDGLVPGSWCVNALYHDSIDNSKRPYAPTILLSSKTSFVNASFDVNTQECFLNGVDTIRTTLYYAPFKDWIQNNKDSLHLFTISISGNVVGQPDSATDRFRLHPGPLDSISIEDKDLVAVPGPLTLTYPSGMAILYSNGFDHYGNRVDNYTLSDWTVNGSLHSIPPPASYRIIYQAVSNNEAGYVFASINSEARPNVLLSDSVQIYINGADAVVDSAVTRDASGNGYIDQIVIFFNKKVSIPSDYNLTNVSVVYDKPPAPLPKPFKFTVVSIAVTSDSLNIVTVYLHDTVKTVNGYVPKTSVPQTDWLPLLSINGLQGASPISNQRCRDGAGPVIWRVLDKRESTTDFSKDTVTVTFSEPIKYGRTGDNFLITTFPDSVFNVFKMYGTDSSRSDTDKVKLSGIPTFYLISADRKQLIFPMTNKLQLMDYNYFNISKWRFVSDTSRQGISNLPGENNQKVRVEIWGNYGDFIAGPNPAIPTFKNVPGGDFLFVNEPRAIDWAKRGEGTVLRIQLGQGQGNITGYINIYDVVGNLVAYTRNDKNLLNERAGGPVSTSDTTSQFNYDVYWNCTNSKGMKVATGVYLVVLNLTSTRPTGIVTKDRKSLKLGIKR
jgi:fibro-slime domain-containing protein